MGHVFFCLPGVPEEMKVVWREGVEPEVARLLSPAVARVHREVELEVRDESGLAPLLRGVMGEFPGVYAKSRVAGTKGSIRIVVALDAQGERGARLGEVEARLREAIRRAGLR